MPQQAITKVTKRLQSMDALKLFAIFLVIWGHTVQHFLSSAYWDEPLYRVIYSFHMPLFMTISGFFGLSSMNRNFGKVVAHKFQQLILPIICWGAVYSIYRAVREPNTPPFWLI